MDIEKYKAVMKAEREKELMNLFGKTEFDRFDLEDAINFAWALVDDINPNDKPEVILAVKTMLQHKFNKLWYVFEELLDKEVIK